MPSSPSPSRCTAHTKSGQRCKRMGDMDPITHTVRCYQHAGVKVQPESSRARPPQKSITDVLSSIDLIFKYHDIEPFLVRDIHAILHMDANRFQTTEIAFEWTLTSYFIITVLSNINSVKIIFRNKLVRENYQIVLTPNAYTLDALRREIHAHFKSDGHLIKLFRFQPTARMMRELDIKYQEGIHLHVRVKGKPWPYASSQTLEQHKRKITPKHAATLKALESRSYPKYVHARVESVLYI